MSYKYYTNIVEFRLKATVITTESGNTVFRTGGQIIDLARLILYCSLLEQWSILARVMTYVPPLFWQLFTNTPDNENADEIVDEKW